MVLVKKERESNFELLRLIAMIFIVLYHFCSSVKAGIDTENRWILLGYTIFHIGVPVFILISGYWTIKLSIRKLISFYLYCFLWYLMCYGISVLFFESFNARFLDEINFDAYWGAPHDRAHLSSDPGNKFKAEEQ